MPTYDASDVVLDLKIIPTMLFENRVNTKKIEKTQLGRGSISAKGAENSTLKK